MFRVKRERELTNEGLKTAQKKRRITIIFPNELWVQIFSYLTFRNLVVCNQVCRLWKQLSDDQILWKHKIQQRPSIFARIAEFIPMIEQGSLTWKEALGLVPFNISSLFERILCMRFEYTELRVGEFEMRRSFVQNASYQFWIEDSNVVCFKKRRSEENCATLTVKDDSVQITHLAQEGNYVFALCFDGRVIQWDYLKQELFQIFETAYSQEELYLNELRESLERLELEKQDFEDSEDPSDWVYNMSVADSNGFVVQNGVVYLKYNDQAVLEIIPYDNSTQARVFMLRDSMKELNHIALIQGHKLYLQGDDAVEVWNLSKTSKMPQETVECGSILSFLMNNNFQYIATADNKLLILDHDKKQTSLRCKESNPINFVSAFNHHFLFGYQQNSDSIFVFNINDGEVVQVPDVVDVNSKDINYTILEIIIKFCKTSTPKKREIPELPTEIWLKIFSSVPADVLVTTTSKVCKSWHALSKDALLWKFLIEQKHDQNTVIEYEPLVEKGILQWQEVYFFSPSQLPSLFNNILKSRYDYGVYKGFEFSFTMGCPFVQNGIWQFSIKSAAIEMKKRNGGNETYILHSDHLLTHLALEGNFLFALCVNGQILQWHYETQCIVRIIDTAYVLQTSGFSNLRKKMNEMVKQEYIDEESMYEVSIAGSNCFLVKEGAIFIKYFCENLIEMIPYEGSSERRFFTLDRNATDFERLIREGSRLFFQSRNAIQLVDLTDENEWLTIDYPNISAMIVENNMLYAVNYIAGCESKLLIFNLKTNRQQIKSICNNNPILCMSIYNDRLLFCFQTPLKPIISIYDIITGNAVDTLIDVVDNEMNNIKEEVIKKIIDGCKLEGNSYGRKST